MTLKTNRKEFLIRTVVDTTHYIEYKKDGDAHCTAYGPYADIDEAMQMGLNLIKLKEST